MAAVSTLMSRERPSHSALPVRKSRPLGVEPVIPLNANIEPHRQSKILIVQFVEPFSLFACIKASVCSISPERLTNKAWPRAVSRITPEQVFPQLNHDRWWRYRAI